jgi:hypothetical protein
MELAGLAEPVRAATSPAGLLRADVAQTPFRDRPELHLLTMWCQDVPWSSTGWSPGRASRDPGSPNVGCVDIG